MSLLSRIASVPLCLVAAAQACCLIAGAPALAADHNPITVQSTARTQDGLPYRLFTPVNYDAAQKYPLVVYLHGAGQRGTDNMRQTTEWNSMLAWLLDAQNRAQYPAFIIAPQISGNQQWVDWSWGQRTSYSVDTLAETPYLQRVRAAITALQAEFSIDADRIYAMGVSMGGYGTWDLLTRNPQLFAGGISADGGAPAKSAARLRNMAIWFFHNADDGTVPIDTEREMYAALAAAGGRPIFSEWASGGHNANARLWRHPEIWPWLFSQRRMLPASAPPSITFTPAGGTHAAAVSIEVGTSQRQLNPTIRYSIDGTVPRGTAGMVYSAPIALTASAIVHAMIGRDGDWSIFHAEPYGVNGAPLPDGAVLVPTDAGPRPDVPGAPADAGANAGGRGGMMGTAGAGGRGAADAGAGGATGGSGGTGGTSGTAGAGGSRGTGGAAGTTGTGGAPAAGGRGGSAATGGSGGGGGGGMMSSSSDGAGCSCRLDGGSSAPGWAPVLLVAVFIVVRRRRRR